MADVDRTSRDSAPSDDVQRIITRLIDGEATDPERSWFDQQAEADPALWRELAQQQQQQVELSAAVAREIATADLCDVPAADENATGISTHAGGEATHVQQQDRRQRNLPSSLAWLTASVGWAAVIVLTAMLVVQVTRHGPDAGGGDTAGTPAGTGESAALSPEEHWRAYLDAPFVQHEMAPLWLQSEPLPDGGIRLRIMRRIEELYDLSPQQVAEMLADLDALTEEFDRARADELRSAIQSEQPVSRIEN